MMRCYGYVQLGGDPVENSGHVGETVCQLVWKCIRIPLGKLEEVKLDVWTSLLKLLAAETEIFNMQLSSDKRFIFSLKC